MANTSLQISLPDALEEFVLRQVEEGGFSGPSDYVQALIHADRERQQEIDELLRDGLASPPEEVTADYRAELRREVEATVARAVPKRA